MSFLYFFRGKPWGFHTYVNFIWMVIIRWGLNIQWMYAAAPPWTGARASIVGCLWSIPIVEVDLKDWQRNFLEVFVFFSLMLTTPFPRANLAPNDGLHGFLHSRRLTSTVPRPKLNLCPFHPALCDLVTISHILFVKANLATNHLRSTLVSCLESKPQS